MADRSGIEWTEATWNPVTGCSKVSPGCAHCYAERLSLRFGFSELAWTPANAAANVVLHPERFELPLSWRRPRMVFVNSMSDLFHELVPVEFIEAVFAVIARAGQHTFQLLTKRHERLAELALTLDWPENLWIGVSIENARWLERADALRTVPAAVRFVSAEPLLGSLASIDLVDIDWLLAGGESGIGYRSLDLDWVRELRDRCLAEDVAFFFKQVGGRTPKAGGRLLDGVEWSQFPAPAARQKSSSGHCTQPAAAALALAR